MIETGNQVPAETEKPVPLYTVPALSVTVNPLLAFQPQVTKGTAVLKTLPAITSKATLDEATEKLKLGKTLIGLIDKAVATLCQPLKDQKKKIDEHQNSIKNFANEVALPIIEAVDTLEKAILAYNKAENLRVANEKLKNAENEKALAEKGVVSIPIQPVIDAPSVKGLRTTWKAEIINTEEVPREYCTVSMVLINEAIRNGVREIKGVRIFQSQKIV